MGDLQSCIVRLPEHDVIEGTRLLACRVRIFSDHAFAPFGEELVARLHERRKDFLAIARHEFAESTKEFETAIVNEDDEKGELRFDRAFVSRREVLEIELRRALLERRAQRVAKQRVLLAEFDDLVLGERNERTWKSRQSSCLSTHRELLECRTHFFVSR